MPATSPKSWIDAEVRCLAGYRANERPVSFLVEKHETMVRAVLESWREPNYLYFKVETADGELVLLRYHDREDAWQAREFVRPP